MVTWAGWVRRTSHLDWTKGVGETEGGAEGGSDISSSYTWVYALSSISER